MKADKAEVSWDDEKNKWLIRLFVGEEVIRRHCDAAKNAAASDLKAAAVQTAADEGYQLDASNAAVI